MKQDITKQKFVQVMSMNNFSHEGAGALFDYLTSLENDLDTQLDFDPIAFRCE